MCRDGRRGHVNSRLVTAAMIGLTNGKDPSTGFFLGNRTLDTHVNSVFPFIRLSDILILIRASLRNLLSLDEMDYNKEN